MNTGKQLRLSKGVMFFQGVAFRLADAAIDVESAPPSRDRVSLYLSNKLYGEFAELWLKAPSDDTRGVSADKQKADFSYRAHDEHNYRVSADTESLSSNYAVQYPPLDWVYEGNYAMGAYPPSIEYLADYGGAYSPDAFDTFGYALPPESVYGGEYGAYSDYRGAFRYGGAHRYAWGGRHSQAARSRPKMSITLSGYDDGGVRKVILLSDVEGCESVNASRGRVRLTFLLPGNEAGKESLRIIEGRQTV
jgi:hypothetical protein